MCELVRMFARHRSLRTCELRDPTLGVHCCLWERMIKRFPNCCFASEGVQFVFSDCARAAESTVCSYVGMMRAGRRRLLEERSRPGVRVCDIITCKKARPNWLGPCGLDLIDRSYITIGFDLVSDAGRPLVSPLSPSSQSSRPENASILYYGTSRMMILLKKMQQLITMARAGHPFIIVAIMGAGGVRGIATMMCLRVA